MMQKNIQQQLFTRDREGVFRTSEGFDTVAKSPGLDPSFIKSALHPYCVYKAPQELLERGEENSGLYPESVVAYHAENGDFVIGRSVYVATDFTGQRSASFTHQYVIPKERKEAFIRDPRRIFGIRGFQSRYDIRGGKEIPELEDIPFEPEIRAGEGDKLLETLGIDRELFRQLVFAVLASVANKKKVFISLNTDISESAIYAKRLLELVYRCLPYAVRRQLGFMTFNSEPEAKQHLHVVFTEKGSIRLPDRKIEKDFIFDFAGGRFLNTELPAQDHAYLDYVWSNRNNPAELQKYFHFCDEAVSGLDTQTVLSAAAYSRLCVLYEVERGRTELYEQDRAAVMNGILSFFTTESYPRKPRLKELFVGLLTREASDRDRIAGADYVEAVIRYEKFADPQVKALIVRCLGIFVSRAADAAAGDGIEGAAPLLDLLAAYPAVFTGVFGGLMKSSPALGEGYIRYRMKRVKSVQAFTGEIGFWQSHSEELMGEELFSRESYDPLRRLMRTDVRKKISLAQTLSAYFDQLGKNSPGEKNRGIRQFSRWMKLAVHLELADDLKPSGLGIEDIESLGFLLDPVNPDLYGQASRDQEGVLHVLQAVYKVLTLDGKKQSEAEDVMARLDPVDLDRAQLLLQKLMQNEVTPARFGQLVTAFHKPGTGGSADRQPGYDYERLLNFVASAGQGTDTFTDFAAWSAEDIRFRDEKGAVHPYYKAALSRAFDVHAPQAFRNKAVSRKLLETGNPSFAALFETVRLRQSGKWARIWAKNKRKIVLRGSIFLILFIAIIAVLWKPVSGWMAPTPVVIVGDLQEKTGSETVTVKASLKEPDKNTKLYVNDKVIENGSIELKLNEGENPLVFKAVSKSGKASETVSKKVTLVPRPLVKAEQPPLTVKAAKVTVTAKAEDGNDPSPEIYINGQLAGTGSVSQQVQLVPGENPIEITAKNKLGRLSEPVRYTVKSNPVPVGPPAGSR
ncbi:hypothetical protein ABH899_004214 [Paenibacillus sp. RC84]